MKTFLSYLTECATKYEFKIKIAGYEIDGEIQDNLEHALKAYGLESISKPKRLPITDKHIDFPSLGNIDVYLMNVVLTYPVTDAQLRQTISDQGRFPLGSIVVIPKNQPEEVRRDAEAEDDDKEKKAILDTEELGGESAQDQVGQKKLDSFIKELETREYEIEGKAEKLKTTNELPMNNKSPVASKKVTK